MALSSSKFLFVFEHGVVNGAGAQAGDDVRLIWDDPQDEVLDVRLPSLKIVRIPRELRLVVGLPLFEDERAGADGGLSQVAVLLDGLAVDDGAPAGVRHRGEDAGVGGVQHEANVVRVQHLDAVDGREARALPGDSRSRRS